MDQAKKDLGGKIRKLRQVKKLTQEELADKADMDYSYLGAIERGERNPTLEFITKIAKGLRVEIYQLFLTGKPNVGITEKKLEDLFGMCDRGTKIRLLSIMDAILELKERN